MTSLLRVVTAALHLSVGLGEISFAQNAPRVWRIGVLYSQRRPPSLESHPLFGRFLARLRELGYAEGRNIAFEWRFADDDYARLPALAADLVQRSVDAVVTAGSDGVRAAQSATTTIPILFVGGLDPVAQGFVKSLAHPGGNTTGISFLVGDTIGKQLETLVHLTPRASHVGLLYNSANESAGRWLDSCRAAGEKLSIQIVPLTAKTPQEIDRAISGAAARHVDALLWTMDLFMIAHQVQIAELSAQYHLPSISAVSEYADSGGLAAYGPSRPAAWIRLAEFVDRILKGAKPGEIPVEQPTKLELVLNRKTAKALGLDIPPELLVQADRVIE